MITRILALRNPRGFRRRLSDPGPTRTPDRRSCWDSLARPTRSPPQLRKSPATHISTRQGGKAEFLVEQAAASELVVRLLERGPGIENLKAGPGLRTMSPQRAWVSASSVQVDSWTGLRSPRTPAAGHGHHGRKSCPGARRRVSPQELSRVSAEPRQERAAGHSWTSSQQQNRELIPTRSQEFAGTKG